MGFLTPLFLAGLAALAVPVAIHLVHRQQRDSVQFPSLMFLTDIPYKERRRRTLRDRGLLALRCLAVALVVLAFARPLLPSALSFASATGSRDVVLLIDRSFSMGYGDHWQQAQAAAEGVIDGLGAQDRAAVLFFDRGVQLASELGVDHGALRAAVAAESPGARGTRYELALDQATQLLQTSEAVSREIVVISDFQQSGRDPDDPWRMPAGIELQPVTVETADATANAAIGGVTLKVTAGGATTVTAYLRNFGDQPLSNVPVALTVGGESLGSELAFNASVNIPPAGTATASFDIDGDAARGGSALSEIAIPEDELPVDDRFFFVLHSQPALPVLVLEGPGARSSQSLYIKSALELSTEPAFEVRIKPMADTIAQDFSGPVAVIINDTPLPGGSLGRALSSYISQGGGVLVAAADGVQGGWPGGVAGYLPGELGNRVERQLNPGSINQLDAGHPAFAVFSGASAGGPRAARVFRYRQLSLGEDDRVLARYDDGAVALAERRLGDGAAIVVTTSLDSYWNELPLSPSFVPMLQRLAAYLAGFEPAPAWVKVDDIVDLARYSTAQPGGAAIGAALAGGGSAVVEMPSGESLSVGGTGSKALLKLGEPGFHAIHRGRERLGLAVNVEARESDLTPLDVELFIASVAPFASAEGAQSAAGSAGLAGDPDRLRLWWYLLIVAALVLAAETVLSNRLSRKPRPA